MHIAAQGQPPLIPIHRHRFETALEQMATAPMATVEPDTVADVQPLHRTAQIRLPQLQNQMIMVVHEHETVQAQEKAPDHFSHDPQEMPPIRVVTEDGFGLVAAGSNVIPSPHFLDPQRPDHNCQLDLTLVMCPLLNCLIVR